MRPRHRDTHPHLSLEQNLNGPFKSFVCPYVGSIKGKEIIVHPIVYSPVRNSSPLRSWDNQTRLSRLRASRQIDLGRLGKHDSDRTHTCLPSWKEWYLPLGGVRALSDSQPLRLGGPIVIDVVIVSSVDMQDIWTPVFRHLLKSFQVTPFNATIDFIIEPLSHAIL